MAAARAVQFVEPEDLAWAPLSPELVLVSPDEVAAQARDRLPSVGAASGAARPRLALHFPAPGNARPRSDSGAPIPIHSTPLPPPRLRRIRWRRVLGSPVRYFAEAGTFSLSLWFALTLVALSPIMVALLVEPPNQIHYVELPSASPEQTRGVGPAKTKSVRPRGPEPRRQAGTASKVKPQPKAAGTRATKPRHAPVTSASKPVRRAEVRLRLGTLSTTGTRVPLLVWPKARRATYYDLQVYRNGDKIFEAWPTEPGVVLPRRWEFHGGVYRLVPGRYTWFVWPGFGDRRIPDYGNLVKKRILRVR